MQREAYTRIRVFNLDSAEGTPDEDVYRVSATLSDVFKQSAMFPMIPRPEGKRIGLDIFLGSEAGDAEYDAFVTGLAVKGVRGTTRVTGPGGTGARLVFDPGTEESTVQELIDSLNESTLGDQTPTWRAYRVDAEEVPAERYPEFFTTRGMATHPRRLPTARDAALRRAREQYEVFANEIDTRLKRRGLTKHGFVAAIAEILAKLVEKVTKENNWKTVIWATVLPPEEQKGWV